MLKWPFIPIVTLQTNLSLVHQTALNTVNSTISDNTACILTTVRAHAKSVPRLTLSALELAKIVKLTVATP